MTPESWRRAVFHAFRGAARQRVFELFDEYPLRLNAHGDYDATPWFRAMQREFGFSLADIEALAQAEQHERALSRSRLVIRLLGRMR